MKALIMPQSNTKITHITIDNLDGAVVKTKCGRMVKMYQVNQSGESDCSKCGTPEEFEAIREVIHQKWLADKEQREKRAAAAKEEQQHKLELHRTLMERFERHLAAECGVNITEHRKLPAGGTIEFEAGGLKFILRGNIW